jgi:hypothetical protein
MDRIALQGFAIQVLDDAGNTHPGTTVIGCLIG